MKLQSNVWFTNATQGYFGKGRIELLEQIYRTGSISKAAKEMKMSYKAAWDAINEMNRLSQEPIVVREVGGKGGGGTLLTPKGMEYIGIYKKIEMAQQRFFDTIEQYADDLKKLEAFVSQPLLRTSARNQLFGEVKRVVLHQNQADITIALAQDVNIVVSITQKSALELDIHEGTHLYVLLKSSQIEVTQNKESLSLAQNAIYATVSDIQISQEKSEVSLFFAPNHTIIATLPNETIERLNLQKEACVWCLFERSSPMLAV